MVDAKSTTILSFKSNDYFCHLKFLYSARSEFMGVFIDVRTKSDCLIKWQQLFGFNKANRKSVILLFCVSLRYDVFCSVCK
jgi:hypothetical protein